MTVLDAAPCLESEGVPPPGLDWVIIGGGIHGVHIATRLLDEARRFTAPAGATRVVARAVDTALSAYARAGFVAAADDPTCPYLRLRPGETWVVAPLSGGGATERACERSVLT